MSRLLFILILLFCVWLAIRWFVRTPPHNVIRILKRIGLAVLVLGVVFLAVTGRLHWIAVLVFAILPLLRRGWVLLRYLPFLRGLYARHQAGQGQRPPASGQQSTVETRFLRMSLNHDSGDMDGEVLEGHYEGHFLSQMSREALLDLLNQCQTADDDSAALLAAYLDRHHDDWREQSEAHQQRASTASGPMSEEEARAILGVEPDAMEEEIIQAHRRLMHKLHPDRGGSDYLAAKINLAKDCLIKG
ncbi:MAG: molecular chaperone DnaJ [Gammaproteobacteria bacterium]|nr:molecular chaperone DnaJ [Gammaproteobacteria bacterium]MCF6362821.1 molecular chaperone DnaJ [Gammaproteobacteria bacterium]